MDDYFNQIIVTPSKYQGNFHKNFNLNPSEFEQRSNNEMTRKIIFLKELYDP